ncbi:hypothetical protein ACIRCZ_18615 [Leifsonia sp. NPDC102414]|uniref:hypothetical protein n=1 Tax=Leifsonia sp. NPDC102414 TaxID=3364124 RepID=UPI00382D68BF
MNTEGTGRATAPDIARRQNDRELTIGEAAGKVRHVDWNGIPGVVTEFLVDTGQARPDYVVDLRTSGLARLNRVPATSSSHPAWPSTLTVAVTGPHLQDVLDACQQVMSSAGIAEICQFEATTALYHPDDTDTGPSLRLVCGPVVDVATVSAERSFDNLVGSRLAWGTYLSERVAVIPAPKHGEVEPMVAGATLIVRSNKDGTWEAQTTSCAANHAHQAGKGFATLADVLTWFQTVDDETFAEYDPRAIRPLFHLQKGAADGSRLVVAVR